VLTLTPFYPSREDERGGFVSEPLGELKELGVRCSVVVVRPWYKARARASEVTPFATLVRYAVWPGNMGLASAGRMLYWRLRSLVQRLHRASPIHILHAHAALPCGEAARRLGRELGVAVVVTVHGLDAYLTEQVSGVAGQQCAIGCRRVYQDAKRVICISEEVRRRILAGSSSLRSTAVVYNGVDTSVFAPTQHSANRDPVVASVGSLIPIKGHDVTLRAIAELNADFSRLRVRIVGEGVEQRRLQALARELGIADRVDFLGRRTRQEVAELLQSSAIFVLPSRFEGLGVAYLEAMASGLPTIAYRGQGIQEVIRHGENGILVAEQAAEAAPRAWAAVLRTLLKNDEMRHALGAAGRHTVEEGYTLRHQAQALLRVYEECLV
jgi:teichuronic acid biosynthesis glycosyltransferase TuaC